MRLYDLISNGALIEGQEIIKQDLDNTNKTATLVLEKYAQMLGALTRELVLMYMPTGGVYFAGSVARAVLEDNMESVFKTALHAENHFLKSIQDIPIRIIKDDTARLIGCSSAGLALL